MIYDSVRADKIYPVRLEEEEKSKVDGGILRYMRKLLLCFWEFSCIIKIEK